jgi:two-component system chemotaxis response regulator CheB
MNGAPARLVAVAASTGGPAVLQHLFSALPGDFVAPIVAVQHIAAGFVEGLATWLNASCDLRVKVAEPGEPLTGRMVYLAPDDRHLGVSTDGRAVISDAAPVNGFRPSATHLFESAGQAYGAGLVAVILTGMGSDGVDGLRLVKARGGRVLAQDQASSVVYGMPREAVAAGVVDVVLAVDELAPWLLNVVERETDARTRSGR